ncbi:putative MalT-like TPR region domain-containing protein [Seiridium unicorne]|uniref:MalT-like TPR region domain-containing protein n=1 Tax=Seiridium unicorne TaxID=138068 RepID=A0ABR2UVD7_9PEZI
MKLFQVVHRPETSSPSFNITIVHPFSAGGYGKRYFKDAFKEFRKRLALNPGIAANANIYVFSFNGKDLMNGRVSVDTISMKLIKHLEGQWSTIPENVFGLRKHEFNEGETIPTDISAKEPDEIESSEKRTQPSWLFISHSLGSWVVKKAISQNSHPSVSFFNTWGTVFLDGLTSSSAEMYQHYLKTLYRSCFATGVLISRDGRKKHGELGKSLKRIDEEYDMYIESRYVCEQRNQDHKSEKIKLHEYMVWLPEDPSKNTNQVGPTYHSKVSINIYNMQLPQDADPTSIHERGARTIMPSRLTRNHSVAEDQARLTALTKLSLEDEVASWVSKPPTETPRESVSKIRAASPEMIGKTDVSVEKPFNDSFGTTQLERASIGSAPNIGLQPLQTSIQSYQDLCTNTGRIINMGMSFLESGDLSNAETAFLRAQKVLGASDVLRNTDLQQVRRYVDRCEVEIRAQLAAIKLLKGHYQEAYAVFQELLACMPENEFGNRDRAGIQRWMGVTRLQQGDYESAIKEFRSLLNRETGFSGEEVQIHGDLALASACLGDYGEATSEIREAHRCLDQLKEDVMRPSNNSEAETESIHMEESEESGTHDSSRLRNHDSPKSEPVITQNSKEKVQASKLKVELGAKRDVLYFTQARINLMWGLFRPALKDSERALGGMKKRWGPRHLKTLECASHNALLLALNADVRKAETACTAALRTMTTELGTLHPLTLETMEHLVRIYEIQSRFLEAADTARSLTQVERSILTDTRLQTLRSRCLYAEIQLKIGNFIAAKAELKAAIKTARTEFRRDDHPDILRCESVLALAYHHCAESQQAEELALRTLPRQRAIYDPRRSQKGFLRQESQSVIKTLLESFTHAIKTDANDSSIHPALLQTLRTISLILLQKNEEDAVAMAKGLLEAMWDRNQKALKHRNEYKDPPVDALDFRYHLAQAIRWQGEVHDSEELLEKAAKHLRGVYQGRSDKLGIKHPATLCAKLELITTNCALGRWEDLDDSTQASGIHDVDTSMDHNDQDKLEIDVKSFRPLGQDTWDLVTHHSLDIFRLHEAQLGENHPDTLRSLLWLLTIQVFLGDQHAMEQGLETALKRIRSEAVREQRLVESLNLEYKIALIVEEFDKPRALEILEEIQLAIQHHTVSCASSMTQSLATLGSNVVEKKARFGADLSKPEV